MSKRFLIFLIFLLSFFGVVFIWWKYSIAAVDNQDKEIISFSINKGESVKDIATKLKNQDLIRDKIVFFTYVRFANLGKNIQAGNFILKRSMNALEIANELTHGTSDVWVRILEGWRIEEIASEISKNIQIPENEFIKIAEEGYLFPDTYLIPKDATAGAIVKIMEDNFHNKVTNDIIEKGKQQGLTISEIITLASIIEREVQDDNDRRIVAGILLKRLRQGWPLQADATIQYALGYQSFEKTWWKKNLTIEDLQFNSIYNTYLHNGLPPGPISNPGISAIKAVVDYQNSDYWFYISDSKGNIHYAKTQEEHQENIDKYLL